MPVDDTSGYQTCANCGLETGFGETVNDVLEADFWPGTVSQCASTQTEAAIAIATSRHR
jgi:hypothetical protein